MKSLVQKVPVIRKANSAYYYFRRSMWRWHPRFIDDNNTVIDKPVFLLGTQGGGLTLLSRILHRHPQAISVTGNCNYWAGDDESQNVLNDILPERLSWRSIEIDTYNSKDHNWLYANDAFLPFYRENGSDVSEELKKQYKSILRRIINLYGKGSRGGGRFIDKSQSLTVRVGLIRKLLEGCNPKFVLITRNPFALAWRAVTKDDVISNLEMTDQDKFKVAVQHWKNSMECVLEDGKADDLGVWKFEDLLSQPEKIISEICEHIELPYISSILPGPDDVIPWGSMFDAFSKRKWYPLRPNVSSGYLDDIPDWAVQYLSQECRELLIRFGYHV